MAYACPVCGTVQADGSHLADHLALTALLHGDDHAAWLDDHLSDWASASPGELADAVAAVAEEVDHETAETRPVHADERAVGRPTLDPEARRAIEEAHRLVRERSADGDERG